MFRWFSCIATAGLMALVLPVWAQRQIPRAARKVLPGASKKGRQIFTSTCAGCHGLDARGGERAPSLTGSDARRLSNREILRIVRNGVPGTAMPAFRVLADSDLRSLLAYIRALQNHRGLATFPGDPFQGKALFFGAAKCSTCHMAEGQGGFIASDLSTYALSHSPEEILGNIQSPQSGEQTGDQIAVVTTREGRKYSGVVRNEDNFSLQLQSLDGAFHFFAKSELRQIEYGTQPLMPADYGSLLSRTQLDNIVSYLVHISADKDLPASTRGAKHP